MIAWNFNLLLLICLRWISVSCIPNATTISRLSKALLKNYDADRIPVLNHTALIQVKVHHFLKRLDFTSRIQRWTATDPLTVKFRLDMTWKDELLHWEPKDYDHIEEFPVPKDLIWKPQIVSYAQLQGFSGTMETRTISLAHDGTVKWSGEAWFSGTCSGNLVHWPFDSYQCWVVIMAALSHDRMELTFHTAEKGEMALDMSLYKQNPHWELNSITQDCFREAQNDSYYICNEDVQLTVVISRKVNKNVVIVHIPVFILCLITLMSLWVQAPYNWILSCTSLIGQLTLSIGYLSYVIPPTGGKKVMIESFFESSEIMACLALGVEILTTAMRSMTTPLSHSISTMILKNPLSKFLLGISSQPNPIVEEESPSEGQEDTPVVVSLPKPKTSEWEQLATLIERFVFVLLSIITILCIITLIPE